MTAQLVVAPMLVALGGAVLTLVVRRWPSVQRVASVLVTLAYVAAVGTLSWATVLGPTASGPAVYQVGDWPAPFGITLVADGLSAFMLAITAVVALASIAVSVRFIDRRNQQVFYHPLFHFLLLGVTGAFLTGDLFNLFVWFEVMLLSSFIFVAFYGGAQSTAAAFRYLVVNVIGSAIMLLAIGGLYATTGTLNMADMSRRLADPVAYGIDIVPVVGLAALLLATFALKAGLVPFQFWVPGAYEAAPLPISAMLAGASKKVGVYAIIRLYFTVFAGASLDIALVDGSSPLAFLAPLLLTMGAASILVGGLGAVSRESIESVLAYSSIGQVGFIAIPIGIAATTGSVVSHLALLAALVYALHHALAKGLLFLSAATIRGATGTNQFSELGGLASRSPVLAGAFFVGSLSLAGIPPLAGFFGKFLVFEAAGLAYYTEGSLAALGTVLVLLFGAVLTLVYTSRTWISSFWGQPTDRVEAAHVDPLQVTVLAGLAVVIIAVGVGFDPVYEFADAAAEAALDREGYVEAVDPQTADATATGAEGGDH